MFLATEVNDAFDLICQIWGPKESPRKNPYWAFYFVPVPTRNGKAYQLLYKDQPLIAIRYEKPWLRTLFNPKRDCNPFFHLYEFVWMMSGLDTVHDLALFSPNYYNYADINPATSKMYANGAYGRRLIEYNQIEQVLLNLFNDPHSRRAVMSLYHPTDVNHNTRDTPCNLTISFEHSPLSNGLCMFINNRSNDLIWGTLGANYVHFSLLHQLICECLNSQMGTYYQTSKNMHIYENPKITPHLWIDHEKTEYTPLPGYYESKPQQMIPISDTRDRPPNLRWRDFHHQCNSITGIILTAIEESLRNDPQYRIGILNRTIKKSPALPYLQQIQRNLASLRLAAPFLQDIAIPAIITFLHYKLHRSEAALDVADGIGDQWWRKVCKEWIERRLNRTSEIPG